jgi:hypothetical protein
MAIDFPASPTLNDVFTVGNVTYVWDGTKWTASVTGGISLDKIEEGNTSAEVIDTGSDGRFVVTTEGSERLRIDSSGRVGIGTNSPGSYETSADNLVVADSGNGGITIATGTSAYGSIYFADGTTATDKYRGVVEYNHSNNAMAFWIDATERVRIDSSGRLGIGTSSPGYRLDVTSQLGCTHSGAIRHLVNIDSDGGKSYWYNGTPTNTAYILGDTGGAYFAGSVGIGTASPAKKLDVYEGSTGNVEQYLRNTTINLLSKIDGTTGAQFGTETSHPLVLLTANSERARIDNSGRLLVGTSTARAFNTHNGSLQIDGDNYSESTVAIIANSNDANGAYLTFAKQRSGSSGGNTVVQNNDMIGELRFNAGDGTDCDSLAGLITCRVDGTPGVDDMPGRLVFSTTADGASNPTERFYLYSDGNVRAPGVYALTTAVAADVRVDSEGYLYRSTSSIRYKKDVETLQDGYADTILNARPVWFRSLSEKDNPDWGYWGFIAEEVEQIDPRLCTYGEDEEGNQRVESVQYDRFVPHLLNLIKRQQQAIETLEGMVAVNNITIDEQQHQLSTLAARLTALETP